MGAICLRQLPAAICRAAGLRVTWTSFSASANVSGETSGPTGGAVPKAGGAPGGGEVGDWPARRHAVAEAIRAMEARLRNCLRDFDMYHIVAGRHARKRARVGYGVLRRACFAAWTTRSVPSFVFRWDCLSPG